MGVLRPLDIQALLGVAKELRTEKARKLRMGWGSALAQVVIVLSLVAVMLGVQRGLSQEQLCRRRSSPYSPQQW